MKRIIFLTAIAALLLSACEMQPEAFFSADRITAQIGEDIFFDNGSMNADYYEWSFGDGTVSDDFCSVHRYSSSGVFTVILTAWSSNGYFDKCYLDIEILSPTMLEVEVLEWYDQYPVAGASVILYPSELDWDRQNNAIIEGFTNSAGIVIFTNLQPRRYYVDVWHETHNNYTLRDEDVGFITTDVLEPNELNQFVAWVDYVGTKSAAIRDRSQVLPLKGRKPGSAVRK